MGQENIAEINRQAWNKILLEGRKIHASEGGKEDEFLNSFIAALPKHGKVLDLGCGTGIPIGKKLYSTGLIMTGVDVSDEMVKAYGKNLPGSSVIRMPMTQINWKEKFDGIISSYSMLCLPPADFAITSGKIARALKKGGWFLLSLNEGNSSQGGIEIVQGQQMFSTGMSEDEIKNQFEPKGMEIVKMERATGETKEYGVEHMMIFLMRKKIA
jgi:predicted TPR repeat methyltransferase